MRHDGVYRNSRGAYGAEFNPDLCKASVHDDFGCSFHQCSRKPKRDGWCGQHHPDAVSERARKSTEKYERDLAARFAMRVRNGLRGASVEQLRDEIARRTANDQA